ncbi:MAG TPA: glucose-1-phosphate thymidylyltransferase RfbA [Stellaceae bacterium]|nr:glucose-1-phosphate thymidylyltransferase RfbA [Stellaceae bacterium]
MSIGAIHGMKGIVLAGGNGTRLYPMTVAMSKQLIPVYDKPMIYYPLSVLMLAGIHEILIITTPRDAEAFRALLGDGSQWGISLDYAVQPTPEGLPQAFLIAEPWLAGARAALVLGDNMFYGHGLTELLRRAALLPAGETIFCYEVSDPERYGVATLAPNGHVTDVVEKPLDPRSHWAVTGLYFVDERACDIVRTLKKSKRGEYEIVDLHRAYMRMGALRAERLGRGYAWFDMGTPEALLEAAQFVQAIERRQGQKVACLEEIAYRLRLIDERAVAHLTKGLNASYGRYLAKLIGGVNPIRHSA